MFFVPFLWGKDKKEQSWLEQPSHSGWSALAHPLEMTTAVAEQAAGRPLQGQPGPRVSVGWEGQHCQTLFFLGEVPA